APEAELGSAGNLISKIPKIGNFLHKSARLGVPQAAYSAIQEPENPGKAAAIGLASGAIAPTLEGVVNALRPSSLLRGNLSPEQLAKNLDVTQGTETGLGRVIESPTLNRVYENVLPHVIGSGAEDTMQRTANDIIGKGNNLLEETRGDVDSG